MVFPESHTANRPLRFGYVPLVECAPVAVAHELGIFERYGLDVQLSRELGWASVRDKLVFGHLDAAQSIAGIAIALGLGINEMRCEVAVPMVLNLHGNAITLSKHISPEKIGRGERLKDFLTHEWKEDRPFTLAVTHRYSSHYALIKTWLQRCQITDKQEVDIIFLPPTLMPRHLKAGHIDGYCVGEPWNSASILTGDGWCPATSSDLSHGHPGKVLIVSGSYLRTNRDESVRLVAALLDSCRTCEMSEFRDELIAILAKPKYTGVAPEVLANSLGPEFNSGAGQRSIDGFHLFHGTSVNRPSTDKASWVLAGMRSTGMLPETTGGSISRIYREDIFRSAEQVVMHSK